MFECLEKEMEKAKINGVKICPKCGQIMRKRNGKFGEFWDMPDIRIADIHKIFKEN